MRRLRRRTAGGSVLNVLVLLCILRRSPTSVFANDAEAEAECPSVLYDPEKDCLEPRSFAELPELRPSAGPLAFLSKELSEYAAEVSQDDGDGDGDEDDDDITLWVETETEPRELAKLSPSTFAELKGALPQKEDASISMDRTHGTCALVGNSGVLARNTFGDEIDQHDLVIRFNRGPTKGYEELVGRRTDLRWFSGESAIGFDEREEDHNGDDGAGGTASIHFVVNGRELRNVMRYRRTHTTLDDDLVIVSPKFLSDASKSLGFLPASVGTIALYYALHVCRSIDLYGFMAAESQGARFHYFARALPLRWTDAQGKEEDFILRLEEMGLIRLREPCARECKLGGLSKCSACLGQPILELLQDQAFTREQDEANQAREALWSPQNLDAWKHVRSQGARGSHRKRQRPKKARPGQGGESGEEANPGGDDHGGHGGHGGKGKASQLGWEYLIESDRIEEVDKQGLEAYVMAYGLDMKTTWLELRLEILKHREKSHPQQ